MKTVNLRKMSVVLISCFLIAAAYCFCAEAEEESAPTVKHEKVVELSEPLPAGSGFEAHTHNGYINVTGADVNQCSVTATIVAKADTEENAQKLAEEVKVELIPTDNKLTVKIEKPKTESGKYVDVSLDITVPNQTNSELSTHNGALKIKDLTGDVNGTTHNGNVTIEKFSGTTKLKTHNGNVVCKEVAGKTKIQTHNGSVNCEDFSGDIKLQTHNGSAKVLYAPDDSPVCDISIATHNGGVSVTAPPNLSAKVNASTHNGSINNDLPITVIGKANKKMLTGTIGTGEGELNLETHNGSIKIK